MFVKEVWAHAADLEVELQTIAIKYGFSPQIFKTEKHGERVRIYMEHLDGYTLSDYYGEEPTDIPTWVWDEMRRIITVLYEEECIEYRDISPYNFMISDDKLYIIDFGDAKYTDGTPDWFLAEFLDGENSWNPDYK